jgi:hypothetical protein
MTSAVKGLAVAPLIALYSFGLEWSSLEQTANWAAKQSEAMPQSGPGEFLDVGRGHAVDNSQNSIRCVPAAIKRRDAERYSKPFRGHRS